MFDNADLVNWHIWRPRKGSEVEASWLSVELAADLENWKLSENIKTFARREQDKWQVDYKILENKILDRITVKRLCWNVFRQTFYNLTAWMNSNQER